MNIEHFLKHLLAPPVGYREENRGTDDPIYFVPGELFGDLKIEIPEGKHEFSCGPMDPLWDAYELESTAALTAVSYLAKCWLDWRFEDKEIYPSHTQILKSMVEDLSGTIKILTEVQKNLSTLASKGTDELTREQMLSMHAMSAAQVKLTEAEMYAARCKRNVDLMRAASATPIEILAHDTEEK